MQPHHTVTELLQAVRQGDRAAFEAVYAQAYDELSGLAHRVRSGRAGDTMDTTALVHEAYLKLAPGDGLVVRDRIHFFRIAARAMRQVLVDAARRRATRDRGAVLLGAEKGAPDADQFSADVLDLEAALMTLARLNPRQAEVVECRFYAGLSVEETAEVLAVSVPTVKRDWRVARAWLAEALAARDPGSSRPQDPGAAPPPA